MPTQNLEDIRARVSNIVGSFPVFTGENSVGDDTIDEGIDQARKIFSKIKPHIIVEDEVGDDGRYYALGMLADWQDDFSEILSIDWDAASRISSDEQVNPLNRDDGDWTYYRDATTRYLVFPNHSPASSLTFRVTYTTFQTLSATTSTVPLQYEEAIIYLAVSRLARIVQWRVEKATDPPGGAQFVTMRNKSSGFDRLAEVYFDLYIAEMGGDGVVAASAVREFDQRFMLGDHYIFHSGRQR